jgi:hypothetical protein
MSELIQQFLVAAYNRGVVRQLAMDLRKGPGWEVLGSEANQTTEVHSWIVLAHPLMHLKEKL